MQGSDATFGRLFGNFVWYPFTGRRNVSSGYFAVVANTGYCYSSTALSIKAFYLGNYTHSVAPSAGSGLNGRAEGFPVRCIRE